MYSSPSSHIALIVIEPIFPYKIRLRCSCGWKNIVFQTWDKLYRETYWTNASLYAKESIGINGIPQKTRIEDWGKKQHPSIVFLDHLYYDSVDLAKMIAKDN